MNGITNSTERKPARQPGVVRNPHGGYHIHVRLKEKSLAVLSGTMAASVLAPPETPTLVGMSVFEDSILLRLDDGGALVIQVTEPAVAGSVLFFYQANGRLQRAVPVEQLNPGWVLGTYHFRGDLGKFEARLARMRPKSWPTRPRQQQRVTLWEMSGWQEGVVYTTTGLVRRLQGWQHLPVSLPAVMTPAVASEESVARVYPDDVQQLLALQEAGTVKATYQVGGLHLLLCYLERLGLAATVNRYCPRQGEVSDGLVILVLVINRLLAPCALSRVATWVRQSGLHLLLGLSNPDIFNYDRLADALLTLFPHWQTIAATLTLRAVEAFGLKVETIHYDLTSVFFQGSYEESDWVTFGYSRDHRPDKPQVNIGLTATADGEVVFPGASDVHAGHVNDSTTTVTTHEQLHRLFGRSDILVTGDRIMQSAANMLTIDRAGGRFLGPVDWTARLRATVANCREAEFTDLAYRAAAGRPLKAAFRYLCFQVKEPLSEAERAQLRQQRRRQRCKGATPKYRQTFFWVRAAIIWDTRRQQAVAQRRQRRLAQYEAQLELVQQRLHKSRYYADPEWVRGHLQHLARQFKDVSAFVQVRFQTRQGVMQLAYRQRQRKIDRAARLDGKWVLVTNQPRRQGETKAAYLDWMLRVYKNHAHVERRMRNLKQDLSIRPLYVHRDEAIISLCFVAVVALMLYTLIERDCQNDPALTEAGFRTVNHLLAALSSFSLSLFLTPSGYLLPWFDTPTPAQHLIWQRMLVPDPGPRVSLPGPAVSSGVRLGFGADFALFTALPSGNGGRQPSWPPDFAGGLASFLCFLLLLKCFLVMLC